MHHRTVTRLGPLVAAMAIGGSVHAQTTNDFDILSIDQLLSIESVLGGATPQWSPDGARILFSSGLAGGGLMTIPPDGGFPTRVPLNLGGAFTVPGEPCAGQCAVKCPEDLDMSGAVDFGDILAILSAWGNKGGPEDLDGSGFVDIGDILVVLAAWGPCE